MEMDTDSLSSALAQIEFYDCILNEKKPEGESYVVKTNDSFTADACNNFFPRLSCAQDKQNEKKNLEYSRNNFDALKCCACIASTDRWFCTKSVV